MNLPKDTRKVPQICEGFLRLELRRWLSQSSACPANTRAWVWSPFIMWAPRSKLRLSGLEVGLLPLCIRPANAI